LLERLKEITKDLNERVLNFFCAMDTVESVVKPMDPFSVKCISIHKIEMARFTEVNKHLWSPEAINYSVANVHYLMKSYISVRG
jgi:hypothetical protein